MKIGRRLEDLAVEVQRRSEAKRDFIAPVERLKMIPNLQSPGAQLQLSGPVTQIYDVNTVAHNQLVEYTKIPGDYYKRLLVADPNLLATNVNFWLGKKETGERRMVRTLDGKVRAVLSAGYRTLENEDLAEAVLPILIEQDLIIMSCEVTDTRLYIKAVDRNIVKDIPTGAMLGEGHQFFDTISPAIVISNSEVGYGALSIEVGVWTKLCTNMAVFDATMRKYHTGARAELSDEVYALLTDETKRLTDAAVWNQARDLVRSAFSTDLFNKHVEKLTEAGEQKIAGDVVEVVKRVAKRYTLSEGERTGVLNQLIQGGNLSRYGLHAAITRHSADVEDYDRATTLERLGGAIIELPKTDWENLAVAA